MRYGSREICNVVLKTIDTGKPFLYLESLKVSSLDVGATTVYARGSRGNPKLLGWSADKESTFKMEDALISPESLAALAGTTVTTGAREVHKKEVLTVTTGNKITLSETPLGTNGDRKFFFTTTDGSSIGAEHTYAAEAATTKYQISAKEVTLYTDVPVGTLIIADYYYTSDATTKNIKIQSDKFPSYFKLEGETLWKRESDGVDVPALYTMDKVKLQDSFSIAMEATGDPKTFAFNVDVFKSPTSTDMVNIDILED
jgi:hypothetical protein